MPISIPVSIKWKPTQSKTEFFLPWIPVSHNGKITFSLLAWGNSCFIDISKIWTIREMQKTCTSSWIGISEKVCCTWSPHVGGNEEFFLNIMPFSPIKVNEYFRGTFPLHIQSWRRSHERNQDEADSKQKSLFQRQKSSQITNRVSVFTVSSISQSTQID
jgi:hypothetical protein